MKAALTLDIAKSDLEPLIGFRTYFTLSGNRTEILKKHKTITGCFVIYLSDEYEDKHGGGNKVN